MSCTKRSVEIAVVPAVVRRDVGGAHRRAASAACAEARGAARESVEAADQPARRAGVSRPSHSRQGMRLAAGSGNAAVLRMTRRFDARGVLERPAEADHAAPVVHRQRHGRRDAQVVEQALEVVDARLQRVGVLRHRSRLVGQAHADVVGHDAAVLVAQAQHQLAPVDSSRTGLPCSITHDFAVARTLVQVALRSPFGWTNAWVERVVGKRAPARSTPAFTRPLRPSSSSAPSRCRATQCGCPSSGGRGRAACSARSAPRPARCCRARGRWSALSPGRCRRP